MNTFMDFIFRKLIAVIYFTAATLFNAGISIYFGEVSRFSNYVTLFTVEGMIIGGIALCLDFLYKKLS